MEITPIGERVLLEPTKEAEKTKGGIYIPETAKEKKRGKIIAVGTLKDGVAIPLKKGDEVLYGGYSSDDVEIDGKEYVFIEYKDVLAKLG